MSVEDVYKKLDEKVQLNLIGKRPSDVYERLDKMYDQILNHKKENKWDRAYDVCRRWEICVEWLKKQKVDKEIAQKYYSTKRQTDFNRLFREVKIKIESDYITRQRKLKAKNSSNCSLKNTNSQANDEIDYELQLPDVPTEEPQPKNKNEITCAELYKIMHNPETRKKGVLIIDVRDAEDFAAGKMAFQDYMVNIPGSKIQPKKPVSYYKNLLMENDSVRKQLEKKADIDIVVLLDSGCPSNKLYTPISMFKKFLDDQNKATNFNRIAILIGGFDKWSVTYPKLVVRPEPRRPSVINTEQQEDIKKEIENNFGFDFPPSPNQNTNTASPILSQRSSGVKALPFSSPNPQVMSNNAINATIFDNLSTFNESQVIPPFISTPSQIKNNAINTYNASLLYNNMSNQPMLPFTVTNQHIIPNAISNPSVLLNDISNYNEIPSHPASAPPPVASQGFYPTLNGTPRIRDAKVVIEKLPPAKPTVDRSSKPIPGRKISSDNSQIIKIEMELENTRLVIGQFERMYRNGRLDDWTKEQYDIHKKKEEKLVKELQKLKSQGPSAPKNGRIYPDLASNLLGLALNTKPRSICPVKPDMKTEDKENMQQPKVKVERMKIEPPPATIQPPPPQVLRMELDEPETEIYREPLRSEPTNPASSALKRSFSSPNLAKVKKHKAQHQIAGKKEERKLIPEVDRSLKPRVQENSIRMPVFSKNHEERFDPVYGNFHPGITGLKNLGNSCYMNSIIQCLSNTYHLANYFNDNRHADHLNKKNDKNTSGYVAEEVAQVIKALWRGQYKSISPRDLKVVVGQYKFQFESCDQQDSHEFLMFLLDWMHNDLKQKSKMSYGRELTVAEKEWEKSLEGQSSIVSKLFFGQLRSTIECTACEQTSTTYETFNSLTMSLPATNRCTLDDCVKKFVSGQKVSEWKCPNCKEPRDGMKKFDLAKLPHIIIIHLNRFGDSGGWLEKKNTAVDFPLTAFDLKPYVVSDADNNSQSSVYNLYAMSNHYGTMDGGHYTAYCRSATQQKWYKYDDHAVSEVPSNQVKSQSTSAYLLFYSSMPAENLIMNS